MSTITVNVPPDNHVKVLDGQGWIGLINQMGTETDIVNAARVSFGKIKTEMDDKDVKLLKYLIENKHTSPLEHVKFTFSVHCPLFIRSQWHRHRTWCLGGENLLEFDLPSGQRNKPYKKYTMSIKDFYEKWHNGSCSTQNLLKKPLFSENLIYGVQYSVSELAKLTNRKDASIREMIRNKKLKAEKINGLYRVTKENWESRKQHQRWVVDNSGRLEKMKLRSIDEINGNVCHTTVKDIWISGEKEVFEVRFSNGSVVVSTDDHIYKTEKGWMALKDIIKYNVKVSCTGYKRNKIPQERIKVDCKKELWKDIDGYERKYQVSNYGRVKNIRNGKIREGGNFGNYNVVTLTVDGKSTLYLMHRLVAECFLDNAKDMLLKDGIVVRHLNGNGKDNRACNLSFGTYKDNTEDRIKSGTTMEIHEEFIDVESVTSNGVETVYDIEVNGPYHNFVVNGICVHNCYNEISRRYTSDDLEFFVPKTFRRQSTDNKQASEGSFTEDENAGFYADMYCLHNVALETYNFLISKGVCREQARGVLPQNLMTTFWATVDLHNLLKFLDLRDHSHAQSEIREYAQAIKQLISPSFPTIAEIHKWKQ